MIIRLFRLILPSCFILWVPFTYGQGTSHAKTDTLFYCNGKTEAIIRTDKQGFYNGQISKFYSSGIQKEILQYQHGNLEGKSSGFFDTGDTACILHFSRNLLHGQAMFYLPGNKKLFTENYFAGKLTGQTLFYDTTGYLKEGKVTAFYRMLNQERYKTADCRTGKPEGLVHTYTANGELISLTTFHDGVPEGRSIQFRQDKKFSVSFYEKGKYVKEDDQNFSLHISVYSEFLKEDPGNVHFLFLRGIAYLHIDKPQFALQNMEKVIILDPNHYKAYYNRAVILSDSLPKQALKDLNSTLKIKKDFHPAYYNLGILYYRDGQYKKARDNFENVLKLQPDHMGSVHNLSMIYGLLGDKNKQEYYKKELQRLQSAE